MDAPGIRVGPLRFLLAQPAKLFSQVDDNGKVLTHFILTVFCGPLRSGTAAAGDDASEVAWVRPEDLDERLTTPGTPERIRRHMPC